MTRTVSSFKQRDLTRAINGVKATGAKILRVEVSPKEGTFVLITEQNNSVVDTENDWEDVK
jgi:hypothetical protein